MKDSEIDRRLAEQDKAQKAYTDMKNRAVRKDIAPFVWMKKNPGKAIIILIVLFMLSAFAFHMIDIKGTIEKRFNIELKDDATV